MTTKIFKLLLDENIPKSIEKCLKNLNHNVIHIRLTNPGMIDKEIISKSANEKRIIIILDKDFGYLVYNQELLYFSI